jgi:hypothetical protein
LNRVEDYHAPLVRKGDVFVGPDEVEGDPFYSISQFPCSLDRSPVFRYVLVAEYKDLHLVPSQVSVTYTTTLPRPAP